MHKPFFNYSKTAKNNDFFVLYYIRYMLGVSVREKKKLADTHKRAKMQKNENLDKI